MNLASNLLKDAIQRHITETKLLIDQLDDEMVLSEPVESGRVLGEIILHMIRSLEYYAQGLAKGGWKALPYNLETYPSADSIKKLYSEVIGRVLALIEKIDHTTYGKELEYINRTATSEEILLEMLEHSVQHRGQLLVYCRLLGMKPV